MKARLKLIFFSFLLGGFNSFGFAQNAADTSKLLPNNSSEALTMKPQTAGTDTARNNRDILPVDGYYRNDILDSARPFPYPTVNRNDVRFFKRVYRDIDLSNPENRVFVTANADLMDIIMDAIKAGKITAYDPTSTKKNPTGDAFTTPLTPAQAMARLTDSVLVPQFDSNGNQIGAVMKLNDFNPESIGKYRIKEDIFFDGQRSRIETRIIGLAPLIKIKAAGELINEQPAFWLYFPQCRYVFVTKEAMDQQRNDYNLSFDDIFIQHKFNSQIVKETNPADVSVSDSTQGKKEIEESDRIQQQIDDYKKNVWRY